MLTPVFRDHLSARLDAIFKAQKERNDPLIRQSTRVLGLTQGENRLKRLIRRVAFFSLETGERISGERAKVDALLKRIVR